MVSQQFPLGNSRRRRRRREGRDRSSRTFPIRWLHTSHPRLSSEPTLCIAFVQPCSTISWCCIPKSNLCSDSPRQWQFPQRVRSDFGLQQANHLETAPNQHCLLELHDAGKCGVISIVLQLTLSGATANMYVHVWFTIGEGAKQAVN